MFLVSGVDLVVAACREGLIGAFPAANARTAARLVSWIADIKDRIGSSNETPFAVNINLQPNRYADQAGILQACRSAQVPLILSSVGNPTEITRMAHEWGGRVFHDVTTIRHAEKAAAAGVDGLILVCAGAGGHSGTASAFSLVPRVRDFFAGTIVVAGGIADGHGIAAARALGADLVYMGTRFIATAESLASDAYKRMLVDSGIDDVVYTNAISGLPANFLKLSIESSGLDSLNLPPLAAPRKPALPDNVKAWRDIFSAGHAVELIRNIPPVAELASELEMSYREALRQIRAIDA